jgi:hypothetical protein
MCERFVRRRLSLLFGATFALIAAVSVRAADPGPGPPTSELAGVYKTRFRNADVSGDSYMSENVLTIAPYRPGLTYFSVHLEFFNGHECEISGIAKASDDELRYHKILMDEPCDLTIRRAADGIHVFEASNGACRNESCGMRGGYGESPDAKADFPMSSRRPIRDLPALLASDDVRDAIREYEAPSK